MSRKNRRAPASEGTGPVSPEAAARLLGQLIPDRDAARAQALARRRFIPEPPPVGLGAERRVVHRTQSRGA